MEAKTYSLTEEQKEALSWIGLEGTAAYLLMIENSEEIYEEDENGIPIPIVLCMMK